jgi:hypothetical protein
MSTCQCKKSLLYEELRSLPSCMDGIVEELCTMVSYLATVIGRYKLGIACSYSAEETKALTLSTFSFLNDDELTWEIYCDLTANAKKLYLCLEHVKNITYLILRCQQALHSHQAHLHCPIILALKNVQLLFMLLDDVKGRLNRRPWELAERHPKYAYRILSKLIENV